MKVVSGRFNGTGAAVYICVGFVPDMVMLLNLDDATNQEKIIWYRNSRAAANNEGLRYAVAAGMTTTALTFGQGVAPYFGGDLLTTSIQTSVTYGEGVYLARDTQSNYARSNAANVNAGDGSGADITKWTLGSTANRTGNFDADVVGTYIGPSSEIVIDGFSYSIEALTAGQGVAANEVTLNAAPASGTVEFIGGMYTFAPMAVGLITPKGFKLSDTTLNTDNDEVCFEAWLYED